MAIPMDFDSRRLKLKSQPLSSPDLKPGASRSFFGEASHLNAGDRAAQIQKLGFGKVAENIATAQVSKYRYQTFENRKSTASIVLAHWIASTVGHREVIEERSYTHTGIGIVSREVYDEDGDSSRFIYVTQLFTS